MTALTGPHSGPYGKVVICRDRCADQRSCLERW